jgi:hypothetical protein
LELLTQRKLVVLDYPLMHLLLQAVVVVMMVAVVLVVS